ncbi:MAG: hypothetical protein IMX02_09360 [Limnochordaceae bacterium]|nr:hypothetical protein [Limnochordaceae bacterium]
MNLREWCERPSGGRQAWLARVLKAIAVLLAAGVVVMLAWGGTLAIRGGMSRLIPMESVPRTVEHAVVVRDAATGRYLLYTEIEVKPEDLVLMPDERVFRIERVHLGTAWARYVGRRAEVLGR